MWQWLSSLSQGQATFLGSLTGSSIGLVAILIGALYNAHLNRKRDDRLRREDRATVTAAVLAELVGFRDSLQINVDRLKEESGASCFIRKVSQVRILHDMVSKLGLLDAITIQKVIAAYNVVERYEKIVRIEGVEDELEKGLELIRIDRQRFDDAIETTEDVMKYLDTAIVALGGRSRSGATAERGG
jgi:hypothetical protein